jgi:hypothetical protein
MDAPDLAHSPQEVHEVSYVEAVSEADRFAEYVDQVLGTAVGIFDDSHEDPEPAERPQIIRRRLYG